MTFFIFCDKVAKGINNGIEVVRLNIEQVYRMYMADDSVISTIRKLTKWSQK